jgi:hypothetical protein
VKEETIMARSWRQGTQLLSSQRGAAHSDHLERVPSTSVAALAASVVGISPGG